MFFESFIVISAHTVIASQPLHGPLAFVRALEKAAMPALPRGYQLDRSEDEITPGEGRA